ncbi:MAG: Ig-like domain-containing protein [Anaerolineales bacterium]
MRPRKNNDVLFTIKKRTLKKIVFPLLVLLVLFMSAAAPHVGSSPTVELGNDIHIFCNPKCDYWDGFRWHCCGNGGGGGGGTTDQPPTITGTLLCAQTGSNGWCVSGAQLQLSASDPQGYTVSIIGDVGDGVEFSCGSSCTEALPNGSATASYTATSDTSNLSASGSTAWKYDSIPPSLSSSITSGTAGANGWFTSAVTVTASASDSISGIASVEYSLSGGAWQSGSSVLVSGDGTHTVQFRATNNAGLTTTGSATIVKIDTSAPTLALSASGTLGMNNWYTSNVTITANSSDSISGIASVQYSLDRGAWQAGNVATISSNGNHTIEFLATDNAGNTATASQSIKIDQTIPIVTFTPTGTLGQNGWYQSSVSLAIAASDSVSGIASLQYSLDSGSTFLNYSAPLSISGDGIHTIQARATSNAGGAIATNSNVKIDTTPPTQNLVLDGTLGNNGWYTSTVHVNLNTSDATSGVWYSTIQNNGALIQNTLVSSDPIELGDGVNNLQFTTTDNAGNSVSASQIVSVDTTPPITTITSPSANSVIFGAVNLAGQASDATSGIAVTQVSLDNGNIWTDAASGWNYVFHSSDLPNGTIKVFARSTDNAGNIGTSASLVLVLDNNPPLISVPSAWDISVDAALSVQPNVIPLKEVKIVVSGDGQTQSLFDGLPAPTSIQWDRVIGNVIVQPGDYPVTVKACDLYGVCTSTVSTITIQQYPVIQIPILPTAIPKPAPVIQITYPVQKKIISPPAVTKVIQPVVVAVPLPIPVMAPTPALLSWPVQTTGFITLMFAFLLLFDPRPAALRSLAKTIHTLLKE